MTTLFCNECVRVTRDDARVYVNGEPYPTLADAFAIIKQIAEMTCHPAWRDAVDKMGFHL